MRRIISKSATELIVSFSISFDFNRLLLCHENLLLELVWKGLKELKYYSYLILNKKDFNPRIPFDIFLQTNPY